MINNTTVNVKKLPMLKKVASGKGSVIGRGRFEGWYYKQRADDYMIAFIPGRADSGAFIQVIDSYGTRSFGMPDFYAYGDTVRTGNCIFSPRGLKVELPGIRGVLKYSGITPLKYDIMGPFSVLPMQCSHGIVSMYHTANGRLEVDGTLHSFKNAAGYIEKDCGRSFPRSYLWIQCNSFSPSGAFIQASATAFMQAFMLSIAHIPFLGASFTGCICVLIYGGKEYRFATYLGVRIISDNDRIILTQGKMQLEIVCYPLCDGKELSAPQMGRMNESVRESCDAYLKLTLTESGKILAELESRYATYEKRQ